MRDLGRGQRSRSCRVHSHSENAAQRTGNESNSSFTIVRHDRYSRHRSLARGNVIYRNAPIQNKGIGCVQESGIVKAKKAKKRAAKSHPKTDRRILRTRDTLGDALMALIREKNFDEITVQDVLDRAGVGRSTFYVHYRDRVDFKRSETARREHEAAAAGAGVFYARPRGT